MQEISLADLEEERVGMEVEEAEEAEEAVVMEDNEDRMQLIHLSLSDARRLCMDVLHPVADRVPRHYDLTAFVGLADHIAVPILLRFLVDALWWCLGSMNQLQSQIRTANDEIQSLKEEAEDLRLQMANLRREMQALNASMNYYKHQSGQTRPPGRGIPEESTSYGIAMD
ncbi:hypothetical protein HDU97_009520, partial [Phlyctochytrium planicorne]